MKRFSSLIQIESPALRNSLRAMSAIVIALIIQKLLNQQFGYWILLTTIMILQTNFGATLRRSKQRVLGTILGVLIGTMLSVMFREQYWFIFVAIPILIFLFIYMMAFSYAVSIFIVSTLLIIIMARMAVNVDPWVFAFARIIDTLIGAGIGIVVSLFFWPSWAQEDFRESLTSGLEGCQRFFKLLMHRIITGKICKADLLKTSIEIENTLLQMKQRFDDYSQEPSTTNFSNGTVNAIIFSQERLHSILVSLHLIQQNLKDVPPEPLKKILIRAVEQFTEISNQLIIAMRNRSELPDFSLLEPVLYDLRIQARSSDTERSALFYHNIFAYIYELKHIMESIKQFRLGM